MGLLHAQQKNPLIMRTSLVTVGLTQQVYCFIMPTVKIIHTLFLKCRVASNKSSRCYASLPHKFLTVFFEGKTKIDTSLGRS